MDMLFGPAVSPLDPVICVNPADRACYVNAFQEFVCECCDCRSCWFCWSLLPSVWQRFFKVTTSKLCKRREGTYLVVLLKLSAVCVTRVFCSNTFKVCKSRKVPQLLVLLKKLCHHLCDWSFLHFPGVGKHLDCNTCWLSKSFVAIYVPKSFCGSTYQKKQHHRLCDNSRSSCHFKKYQCLSWGKCLLVTVAF